jgi:2-polyprenyl-3-methyl-5-hydroxy-6-metoxy-1,4-benzoquinol methylase
MNDGAKAAIRGAVGGYYSNDRADVVAKLPLPLGRVLDVGCGAGGVGRSLRAAGASELVGVELHVPAAAKAREVFDQVHTGSVEEALAGDKLRGPFDTVVLYDVLEHLVDPAATLRALAPLVATGGRLHASVPNARHWSLMRDLVIRGTFGYTDWGHRDATHLRWFTRRDIEALLRSEGFQPVESSPAILGRNQVVDRLTFGRAQEFLALQWHVLALRSDPSSE